MPEPCRNKGITAIIVNLCDLFADQRNRRAAILSAVITALICVVAFFAYFSLSSMWYLSSLNNVEAAGASDASALTRGKIVTIDDSDRLLMDSGYETSDYERSVALKAWEQIKNGDRIIDLVGMEPDDARRVMRAAGLADTAYSFRNIQLPMYQAVYWELDDYDVRDMASEHQLAVAALRSAGVTDGMSARSAVGLIDSYIREHTVYDDTLDRHSASQAFQGLAVCSGYAEMFRLMCECANIPCSYVRGTAEDSLHAWNAVQLDGRWYYIDVTWNDIVPGMYYLTDKLWDDHTLDEDQADLTASNPPLPEGAAMTHISMRLDDNGDSAPSSIAEAVQNVKKVAERYNDDDSTVAIAN